VPETASTTTHHRSSAHSTPRNPAQVTEVRYETALSRVYPEDRAIVERVIRRSVTSGEPYFADHRIVLPNGDMRWLHSAGRVISGDSGTAERIRGITIDITDRPGMRTVG